MVIAFVRLHMSLDDLFQTGAHMTLIWYQHVRQLVMYFPTGWILATKTANDQVDILTIL
jgi:hypothetical protein